MKYHQILREHDVRNKVPISIFGCECQVSDYLLAHTFISNTGVVSRKQNRDRFVIHVRIYVSRIDLKTCLRFRYIHRDYKNQTLLCN